MNRVPVDEPDCTIAPLEKVRFNDTSDYDVIVSVCQDTCWDNVSDDTITYHVPLADSDEAQRNWGGKTDYGSFCAAASYVLSMLLVGHNVLVHCHAGQNRSCGVSAAALAVYHDRRYSWAINRVREARPMNTTELIERHARRFVDEIELP